jgi:hypothetical protein
MRNSYSFSSNPFDALRNTAVLPQFGTLQTPTYISWNNIPKTIEVAGVTATYDLNTRTNVYASADYQYLGYQNIETTTNALASPQQTQSGSLGLGISRQVSARYSGGLQYMLQVLDYGNGEVHTTAHSLEYQAKIVVKPNLSISAVIGPQYLDTTHGSLLGAGNVADGDRAAFWSWIGGVTLTWSGRHDGLGASIIRQVNTGTGFEGNVQQVVANIQVHREVTKRSAVSVFANYTMNQPLVPGKLLTSLSSHYLSAGIGYTLNFSNRLTFGATYWAIRQGGAGTLNPLYSGDHDRMAISLSYQVTRPLRR